MALQKGILKRLLAQLEPELYAETVQFFQWLRELESFSCPSSTRTIGGLWYRQNVANVVDLNAAAKFYTTDVSIGSVAHLCLNSIRQALRRQDQPGMLLNFIRTFNAHIGKFIKQSGVHQLPFHPQQKLYFKMNPYGHWSNNAVAVFHQQVRIGYLRAYDAADLLSRYTAQQISNSTGYIVQANDGEFVQTRIQLAIPSIQQVRSGYQVITPQLIHHEEVDPVTLIHTPLPAFKKALQIQQG